MEISIIKKTTSKQGAKPLGDQVAKWFGRKSKTFFSILLLACALPHFASAATLTRPANNLSLVGYWPMNEGTSTIAGDFSGNRNNGTMNNFAAPPTSTSGWGAGRSGAGLNVDGTNDYISLGHIQDGVTSFTWTAWVKTTVSVTPGDGYYNMPVIIGTVQAGGNTNDALLGAVGGNLAWYDEIRGNSTNTGIPINDGKWHHVAVTWDSGVSARLYVDGVVSGTNPVVNSSVMNSLGLEIAKANWNANRYWTGSIDEVYAYNRALSATQIANLYKSGVGKLRAPNNLNLAAYWSMNEGVGTQAGDFSGNGNTGTLTNGLTWTSGKFGKAVNLDGSAGYVDLGSNTSLNVGSSQAFTISGWVNTSENEGPIVSLRSNTADGPIIDINLGYDGVTQDNGKIMTLVRQDGASSGHAAKSSTNTVNDGKWHFFTLTRNAGSTIELYVDGVSNGTASGAASGGAITTTTYRAIGSERRWVAVLYASANERYLLGQVDDVRMYVGKQLSATEIATLYKSGLQKINSSQNTKGPTSGLVGMWSFNGPDVSWATNIATDRSGNGNNGTITNMSTSTAPTIGKVGQAFLFDGSNDYITTTNTTSWDSLFANGVSISAWVKYPNFSTWQRTVTIENNANNDYDIWMQGQKTSAVVQCGSGGGLKYKNGTTAMQVNVWYHIVCVTDYTNGGTKIYVNGVDDGGTVNATPTYTADKGSLDIGRLRDASASYYGAGTYDEVRIYNRAITAAEVSQLYLMGK